MEWESVAAIELISFKGWWDGLPQEARKNVRRSQKRGVVIQVKEFDEALIEGIRSINDDSPIRQGAKNAYYGLSAEGRQGNAIVNLSAAAISSARTTVKR